MCVPAGLHEDAYNTPKLVGAICDLHPMLRTPYRYSHTDLETSSKFVNVCICKGISNLHAI